MLRKAAIFVLRYGCFLKAENQVWRECPGREEKRSRTKRMSKIYYVDSEKDDSASIQALLDTCAGEEAEIIFRQGTYYLDKGLVLTKEHRNLILRGEGEVRLNGGKQLKNWTRAEGTPAAERFDTDARSHT